MKQIKAPHKYDLDRLSIFLAGSIEMNKAEDWQNEVVSEYKDKDIIILNPRRDDWDSTWKQSIENEEFLKQVTWELTALEKVDMINMYFAPGTFSPISLLELGLFHNKPMMVCCPEGYWRRGNVEITCRRYLIPFFSTLEEMVEATLKWLKMAEDGKRQHEK